MKKPIGITLVLLALNLPALASEPFDAATFVREKCTACHDDSVYTRPNHRMQNLEQLEKQVRFCDANVDTRLFNEDIEAVTDYLNRQYYHFK